MGKRYTKKELELRGFSEYERQIFEAYLLNGSNDIKKDTEVRIANKKLDLAKEEMVLTGFKKESDNLYKKCEENLLKQSEPLNKYHDLCVKSVVERVKLFGYDAYSPKSFFINGEDIFTPEDYEKFTDIPRELDEDKKGELRQSIVDTDKLIAKTRSGAMEYMQKPRKEREDAAFAPYDNFMKDVVKKQAGIIRNINDEISALDRIGEKLSSPINKEYGLSELNKKRTEYNKINRASRFFSYFLPNKWTKAGKARNEIKSYESFLKGNGFTENEISTGKIDMSAEKREIIRDEPIERKSIEINELKNDGLNSSKVNMVDEPNEKEKEVVKTVEEPVYKAPQK